MKLRAKPDVSYEPPRLSCQPRIEDNNSFVNQVSVITTVIIPGTEFKLKIFGRNMQHLREVIIAPKFAVGRNNRGQP